MCLLSENKRVQRVMCLTISWLGVSQSHIEQTDSRVVLIFSFNPWQVSKKKRERILQNYLQLFF